MVSHFSFEVAKEALATIGGLDKAFFSGATDELHQGAELILIQLHFGVIQCSSGREYRKKTPLLESQAGQQLLDFRKLSVTALVYAGNHIKFDFSAFDDHFNGICSSLEGALPATHPVVILFQTI